MLRSLKPYLELIRLPNVVTAAADSLAGWLLVTGSVAKGNHWMPLAACSMILYAAGTALNDVYDFEVDRQERPGRPLPSGRVSRRTAAVLGGLGLALGPAVAYASGRGSSAIVAAALAFCILSYDAGLKQTPLGPAFMGACRSLNVLLGMTHAPALGGPLAWTVVLAYGSFVAGITLISRSEVAGGGRATLVAGLVLQELAIVALAGAALHPGRFPNPSSDRPVIPLEGILVLALVALTVNVAAARAIRQPSPHLIQKTVKTGILSLIWLHVGLVAAVRGPELAAPLAVLWLPAYLLAHWLYST